MMLYSNRRLLGSIVIPGLCLCGFLALTTPALAKDRASDKDGLKNATILVIRHGEKPDKGAELSKAGKKRAKDYVSYFKNYTVNSKPLKVDYLYAAADTSASHRPRLTIEPFSKANGIHIDATISDAKYRELVEEIKKKPQGKQYLICWHHEEIPQLADALGADSKSLIGTEKWPEDVYGWVIQLCYDSDGKLADAKRIQETGMPGVSGK
jgi:hypothetical protein